MQEKEKVAFLLSFQTLSISLNRVKHNSKYVYLLMQMHEWIDWLRFYSFLRSNHNNLQRQQTPNPDAHDPDGVPLRVEHSDEL